MKAQTTLLELLSVVNDVAKTEDEAIATIVHLVNSGTVRLGGTFRGARIDLAAPRTAPAHAAHVA